MSAITVRPATHDDIDAMYDISCAVHRMPLYKRLIPSEHYVRYLKRYTPTQAGREAYRDKMAPRISLPAWRILIATIDGVTTGFTLTENTGKSLILKGLFVDERYQGQGVGRELFESSYSDLQAHHKIQLEVIKGNTRAVEMYERRGFRPIAEYEDGYYGATMVIMQKD